jgi:hypothetical protein
MGSTGINAVFQQLLYDTRRPLDHLTGGNLIGNGVCK